MTSVPQEEPTNFLYPFIEGDERDAGTLLVDLSNSAHAKVAASGQSTVAEKPRNGAIAIG